MTNIFKKFYFFTKLSTSIVLFLIIILLIYIFSKSYLDKKNSQNTTLEQTINQYNQDLDNKFKKQNTKLNNLSSQIINLEQEIKKIEFNNENKEIKNQLSKLTDDLNDLLSNKNKTTQNNLIEIDEKFNKKIIINTYLNSIEISIERGIQFDDIISELNNIIEKKSTEKYLKKLLLNSKGNILSYEEIVNNFNYNSNLFLKQNLLENSKNQYLLKYFLNFFTLKTDHKSKIKNEKIKIISLALNYLHEKNITNAIIEIEKIKENNNFFNKWIYNAKKYDESLKLIKLIKEDLLI